jgi:hypothetical protein
MKVNDRFMSKDIFLLQKKNRKLDISFCSMYGLEGLKEGGGGGGGGG